MEWLGLDVTRRAAKLLSQGAFAIVVSTVSAGATKVWFDDLTVEPIREH